MKFGEHMSGVSKAGNDYNILKLSDGIESKVFSTNLPKTATTELMKGDEVTVEVQVDMFEDYKTFLVVGIEKK